MGLVDGVEVRVVAELPGDVAGAVGVCPVGACLIAGSLSDLRCRLPFTEDMIRGVCGGEIIEGSTEVSSIDLVVAVPRVLEPGSQSQVDCANAACEIVFGTWADIDPFAAANTGPVRAAIGFASAPARSPPAMNSRSRVSRSCP